MTEMLYTLGTWNWLIFGLILMTLELLAPGVFPFWLGLSALAVAAPDVCGVRRGCGAAVAAGCA